MNVLHIIAATFGAGAGGAAVSSYRDWRQDRREAPASQRNSGIMTDRRAGILHGVVIGIAVAAAVWMVIFILVVTGKLPIWMFPMPYGA